MKTLALALDEFLSGRPRKLGIDFLAVFLGADLAVADAALGGDFVAVAEGLGVEVFFDGIF